MKKSLVAAAGASLAAAALPAVGVFAATSQVIDTVQVTIGDSCTIINQSDSTDSSSTAGTNGQVIRNSYAVAMSLGQLKTDIGDGGVDGGTDGTTGGQIQIVCNGSVTPSIDNPSDDPYTPSTGAGSWKLSALAANSGSMVGANNSSNTIATGEATSGSTSNWAFKIIGTSGSTNYEGTYSTYKAIPSAEDTEIIRGKGAFTFKPRYQVYIGTSQAADTYTGTVTYTLTAPAA